MIPSWVTFPEAEWAKLDAAKAGFDPRAWKSYLGRCRPRESREHRRPHQQGFGAVVTRGGYLVHAWGDPDRAFDSASAGKPVVSIALQLAIDRGLIKSADDPIHRYWTGAGALDSPHKHLDAGYHATLTFAHLHDMRGGFPVSNGATWAKGEDVPAWALCTGDPRADNYAQAKPGEHHHYSSGGRWRLAQALTAIWGRDLQSVLNDELLSKMAIPAERWTLRSGRYLATTTDYYVDFPGYGRFCDPPYEIAGQTVRGGGGWLVMSPKDLARIGLLVASRGVWNGRRLVSDTRFLSGWGGANGSQLGGVGNEAMLAFGAVTVEGLGGSSIEPMNAEKLQRMLIGPVAAS
ncbi:MAG: serine hydrolase [Polyangiales bacterium]